MRENLFPSCGGVLTPIEVAKALRASTDTVCMELNSGKLRSKRVGRQYRICKADLMLLSTRTEELYLGNYRPHILPLLKGRAIGSVRWSDLSFEDKLISVRQAQFYESEIDLETLTVTGRKPVFGHTKTPTAAYSSISGRTSHVYGPLIRQRAFAN